MLICGFPAWGMSAELTKVRVQMDWDPTEVHPGYLLAKDLGFYAQEGLDVEFLPGRGSALVASIMAVDKAQMGFIDAAVLLSAKEKGVPIKAVAATLESNPLAVFFLKENGISSPKDLKGKNFLSEFKSFRHYHLLALLNKAGLSAEDLTILDFSGSTGARLQILFSKKVDAVACNSFSAYYKETRLENVPGFGRFLFRDFGVEAINKVVAARIDFAKENPKIVSGFLKASAKGWKYALENTKDAARALVKYSDGVSSEKIFKEGFEAMIPFIKSAETQKLPWGFMSSRDWQETQKVFVETGLLKKKMPLEEIFTNEFLAR